MEERGGGKREEYVKKGGRREEYMEKQDHYGTK